MVFFLNLQADGVEKTHVVTIYDRSAFVAYQMGMGIRFVAVVVAVIVKIDLKHLSVFFQNQQGFVDCREADGWELCAQFFIKLGGVGVAFGNR